MSNAWYQQAVDRQQNKNFQYWQFRFIKDGRLVKETIVKTKDEYLSILNNNTEFDIRITLKYSD